MDWFLAKRFFKRMGKSIAKYQVLIASIIALGGGYAVYLAETHAAKITVEYDIALRKENHQKLLEKLSNEISQQGIKQLHMYGVLFESEADSKDAATYILKYKNTYGLNTPELNNEDLFLLTGDQVVKWSDYQEGLGNIVNMLNLMVETDSSDIEKNRKYFSRQICNVLEAAHLFDETRFNRIFKNKGVRKLGNPDNNLEVARHKVFSKCHDLRLDELFDDLMFKGDNTDYPFMKDKKDVKLKAAIKQTPTQK